MLGGLHHKYRTAASGCISEGASPRPRVFCGRVQVRRGPRWRAPTLRILSRSGRLVSCAPQKLDARAVEGERAQGLDLADDGAEDRAVIHLLRNVAAAFARFFAPRAVVAAENLLLHHQLVVLRRSLPRPRLRRLDQ